MGQVTVRYLFDEINYSRELYILRRISDAALM